MWHDSSNYKKTFIGFIILLVIATFSINFKNCKTEVCHAETVTETVTEEDLKNNIEGILDDIDSNELDDYISNDLGTDFLSVNSFKELVSKILDGTYFEEYDSLFGAIIGSLKSNFKSLFSVFIMLLIIVILSQIFNSFCSEKNDDLKKAMRIVFSLLITLVLVVMFTKVAGNINGTIDKIFKFLNVLFPILLNLILLSGATNSHSVYSSLSVFLLNTGSYVFVYVLLPLAISILLLVIVGSAFDGKRFSKIIDIFKSIFKYIVAIFFGIFGVLSAVNLIMSGAKDGVSIKLTKFAIKNYVPILGGYISEGFDFVHTCSILVKNAFGVCGIFVLLFMVISPLIVYLVYMFLFKLLAAVVSFIGDGHYASMFENVSKCMSYFVAVLVGVFLIFFVFIYLLVLSVSVV